MSLYQSLAETEPMVTEYLLDDPKFPRTPRGDVTGFYGDGSVGKGRMITSLVAEVARNGWTSIVILPEDHPNEQVRPRMEAAGVEDLDLVKNLTRLPGGSRFKLSAAPKYDGDVSQLREAIYSLREDGYDVRLVVLDPIAAMIGWGTINTNQGARIVVEGLQDLAADTGVSIVLVAHTIKNGKLQGSAGLEQALRLLYKVSKDTTNPLVRIVSIAKGNNEVHDDLRFMIEDDGNGPHAVWLTETEIEKRNKSWRAPVDTGKQAKILAALTESVSPLTVKQLSDMTETDAAVVRTLLWRMKQRGQVAQTADGWVPQGITP